MSDKPYAALDGALDDLAAAGPDLRNGNTNHAPMAIEALCALGRGDAVPGWFARYRAGLMPSPARTGRIDPAAWREALGIEARFADWQAFFAEELAEASVADVLRRWLPRLTPGIAAAATHGALRTGHAARSLAAGTSPARLRELASGLGYWAATFQTLPADAAPGPRTLRPDAALTQVPIVPPARRRFAGSITSSLEVLDDASGFPPVIGLLDTGGDPTALLHDLTETFARVYLAHAHDLLTTIVFVHGVTGIAALEPLLPYLDDAGRRDALRFAWQTSAALYATFANGPEPTRDPEPPRTGRDELVARAVENGDEHVIKLTEACLRQHARRPSAAYLAAPLHAATILRPD